ncbi:Zinc D-Ala-D-Ala carboxypeptidase precursor [Sporotomaculum syntrophicum]|uniref:Zinc D-Ala-D-Ala carboxypeptidase n=1 Tax=Sporotomaculum syntrophicum TaxID=182264 RepID=A0A9D3AZ90_9FIRM|nr:D-Ala-D-Ala carboxypeptidase family metallohydrolase [Sporotomaculum syntrophicum]KAF1086291.1 Zinc D-Ala-D-Ala carboxypeptidase precursor [Sporotomaculum syntrophicum]
MQIGTKGANVKKLQQQLAAAGFNPGPADALFGALTRRAVAQLQRSCGLKPDGSAGPQTLAALELLLPHRPRPGHRLSPHFTETEFACRCCGLVRANPRLVHLLEQLREQLGNKPVVVSSAYRCAAHNRAVGGARQSQHLLGNAADIAVTGVAPREVAAAAEKISFAGVGRYAGFTHVDVRLGGKARWVG